MVFELIILKELIFICERDKIWKFFMCFKVFNKCKALVKFKFLLSTKLLVDSFKYYSQYCQYYFLKYCCEKFCATLATALWEFKYIRKYWQTNGWWWNKTEYVYIRVQLLFYSIINPCSMNPSHTKT